MDDDPADDSATTTPDDPDAMPHPARPHSCHPTAEPREQRHAHRHHAVREPPCSRLPCRRRRRRSGGLRIAPEAKGGPVGIARPLPVVNTWITAADLQRGMSPTERQSLHQGMISRLRGDAGFLAGFSFGQPLAPSRQVQVADDGGFGFDGGFVDGGFALPAARHRHHRSRPIIINNQGPLAVTNGNGNVVQQQTAIGPGPIAQQQMAGTGPGGALNLVTGSGNIVQRAPGTR